MRLPLSPSPDRLQFHRETQKRWDASPTDTSPQPLSMKHLKTAHVKNHQKTKRTTNNLILTLCKLRRERKPGWLQNAKTLLIGTRALLPLNFTCHCSRTNERNSASAGSTCDPLNQLSSKRLTSSCTKR